MDDARKMVQRAYADVARKQSSCCQPGSSCCGDTKAYTVPDHPVPESELGLSCGNPLAFGYINPGDVVLDLGTGAFRVYDAFGDSLAVEMRKLFHQVNVLHQRRALRTRSDRVQVIIHGSPRGHR
jgi:hypothetical protein